MTKRASEYYITSDGWFTYYVNAKSGKKKFRLNKKDKLIRQGFDDFSRGDEA